LVWTVDSIGYDFAQVSDFAPRGKLCPRQTLPPTSTLEGGKLCPPPAIKGSEYRFAPCGPALSCVLSSPRISRLRSAYRASRSLSSDSLAIVSTEGQAPVPSALAWFAMESRTSLAASRDSEYSNTHDIACTLTDWLLFRRPATGRLGRVKWGFHNPPRVAGFAVSLLVERGGIYAFS
jgi:hypothetical protein